MLLADRTRDYAIGALGAADYEARFRKLEKQARQDVRGAKLERLADVRYAGQSYELTIAWPGGDFHKEHKRIYGYSDPRRATQVVTLRVRAVVHVKKPSLRAARPRRQFGETRRVWIEGRWREVSATARGPALIADYGSTTLVPPGWSIRQDSNGSLILETTGASSASASSRSS
jgi:N-methylhydantoinase A